MLPVSLIDFKGKIIGGAAGIEPVAYSIKIRLFRDFLYLSQICRIYLPDKFMGLALGDINTQLVKFGH